MKLSTGIIVLEIPDLSRITDKQKQRCRSWIAALRSGEYKQATGMLRTPDGFCCLGVGCDVAAKEGTGAWQVDGWFQVKKGTGEDNILPPEIREYYGLPELTGLSVKIVPENKAIDDYPALTLLNDEFRAPFPDLANILETAVNGGLKQPDVQP